MLLAFSRRETFRDLHPSLGSTVLCINFKDGVEVLDTGHLWKKRVLL